jgi:hypothetical protein
MQSSFPYPPRAISSSLSTEVQKFQKKIKDLQQAAPILAAIDRYMDLEASHKIQKRTTISTLLMATPVFTGIASNSVNVAHSCAIGTQSFSSFSCGSAAASLAGVIIGAGGLFLGIVNLREQATHLQKQRRDIDEELYLKLSIPPESDTLQTNRLISEFSEFSDTEKLTIRNDLNLDVANFTAPR